MKLTRLLIVAAYCGLFAAGPLSAQQRWPVFLEGSLGFGRGSTRGDYLDNNPRIAALDALLGVRLRSAGRGSLVGAVTIGALGDWRGIDDICVPAPDGGCVPAFPGFGIASLLVGWETKSANLRVLAGPAGVRAEWEYTKLAIAGRVDGAVPLFGRLSLVAGGQGLLIPSYFDDAFQLFSFGAGLRIR